MVEWAIMTTPCQLFPLNAIKNHPECGRNQQRYRTPEQFICNYCYIDSVVRRGGPDWQAAASVTLDKFCINTRAEFVVYLKLNTYKKS